MVELIPVNDSGSPVLPYVGDKQPCKGISAYFELEGIKTGI